MRWRLSSAQSWILLAACGLWAATQLQLASGQQQVVVNDDESLLHAMRNSSINIILLSSSITMAPARWPTNAVVLDHALEIRPYSSVDRVIWDSSMLPRGVVSCRAQGCLLRIRGSNLEFVNNQVEDVVEIGRCVGQPAIRMCVLLMHAVVTGGGVAMHPCIAFCICTWHTTTIYARMRACRRAWVLTNDKAPCIPGFARRMGHRVPEGTQHVLCSCSCLGGRRRSKPAS